MKITSCSLLLLCKVSAQSQLPGQDSFKLPRVLAINPHYIKKGDSVLQVSGICKPLLINANSKAGGVNNAGSVAHKHSFIKLHGNLQYDFTYRSLVDTPFYQNDFAQHTLQARLQVLVKERLPVTVILLARRSNSPYFENINDVRMEFNQRDYLERLKSSVRAALPTPALQPAMQQLYTLRDQLLWRAEALDNWMKAPGRVQELVEAREKELAAQLNPGLLNKIDSLLPNADQLAGLPGKLKAGIPADLAGKLDSIRLQADSIAKAKLAPVDSVHATMLNEFKRKQQELDSIKTALLKNAKQLQSLERKLNDSLNAIRAELAAVRNPAQLKAFTGKYKAYGKNLPQHWQTVAAIRQLGIGRSWIDYSELTVKNISLTGLNVEFNPGKLYFAFAGGRLNDRFRDFVVRNTNGLRQSLRLLRAGYGQKEGNHIIATWYNGTRNLLNVSTGGAAVVLSPERIAGLAVELRMQLDADNFITLESAKSSYKLAGTAGYGTEKITDFRDHSNEAWSIKFQGRIKRFDTRILGSYRKWGHHFQSFNLQPTNSSQQAYQIRVRQSLWKNRLQLDAGIRHNDFTNPNLYPGISSNVVFKTLQLSLRVPKYPYLSIGYFPGSQLTVVDNNRVAESQYQTFTAISGYSYRAGSLAMHTTAMYMRFFNHSPDSGFIYYNAGNLSLTQLVFWRSLQLQTGYTRLKNPDMQLTTLEQSARWQPFKRMYLSGGLKYNWLKGGKNMTGYTGGAGIELGKWGTIQAVFERSFLPGLNRNLLPVSMGRLGYVQTF